MGQPMENGVQSVDTMNGPHNAATGSCLKILIVGAGIGGLTAAVALRRQGHEVIVSDQ